MISSRIHKIIDEIKLPREDKEEVIRLLKRPEAAAIFKADETHVNDNLPGEIWV